MQPLVIRCLHTVHLIQQKINLIIIEAKIEEKKQKSGAKSLLYMQKKI